MKQTKAALVTGSTRGIGLAIAGALAGAGYDIMLNGFGDEAAIERVREQLSQEHGVSVYFHGADLSEPEEIEAMMLYGGERLGGFDVIVNNAGLQYVAPVHEFPVVKWNEIIAVVLSASFHTARLGVSHMVERGWGRIINIASAHALTASPYKSAYVAAKHGVAGLTKTVALEVATSGVTVNAICPGYVWTDLVANQVQDTARARGMSEEQVKRDVLLAAQPTKQFVTVQQVASAVLYLCSEAASNVNGTTLSMDGGWTA